MAIKKDTTGKLFTLLTKNSMYQMKVDDLDFLVHTRFGKRTQVFDYSYLNAGRDRGFSGNPYAAGDNRAYSLDTLPQEFPTYGNGDYRESAVRLRYASGASSCEFRYASAEILEGKYSLPGLPAFYALEEDTADTLVITLKDSTGSVYVHLYYGVLEEKDIITRSVTVENKGDSPVYLERIMSTCTDFQYGDFDFISFYGRHAMERLYSRTQVHHGIQSVGSTRGASSHHYNPFVMLAAKDTTETSGECYGFSFLYSGDFLAEAEKDQSGQTRFLMGIHPDNFCYKLESGDSFHAPEAAMVYSSDGMEAISHRFHCAIRNNLCRGEYKKARRPVLINNWEGTYFNFTGDKLVEMAKQAKDLGAELFVMDDGWFGKRESDNSGLGDWIVNEKKLGCSLHELSRRIHDLGLKFGIWFEPECISEDSDLYRAHPDWAFKVPEKDPVRSRYQLVLDFSRKEVRDYIYKMMCDVLDNAQVEYLKWDFNRSIGDIFSAALPADRQGEAAHKYVLGLYEFLENLNRRYPHMLIEGCSGGGGRFDAGMLYYTPQIWTSDDTDSIERLKIQYGTSFAYPVSTMGAHVSASPNHQTGRAASLATRATVAMAGTFGYELDPAKLSEQEKEEVREQIETFKKYYFLIQDGTYYRLASPYENEEYTVWEFAAPDKSEALLGIVSTKLTANNLFTCIRLRGLDPDAMYRIGDKTYPGAALMDAGLPMPVPDTEYQSWNLHLVKES